jgi:hypothetical protein
MWGWGDDIFTREPVLRIAENIRGAIGGAVVGRDQLPRQVGQRF